MQDEMGDIVERLRKHADDQIDNDLAYIKKADGLMIEAVDEITSLRARLAELERERDKTESKS